MKIRLFCSALVLLIIVAGGCTALQDYGFSPDPNSDEGIAASANSRLNSDSMTARATLSVSVQAGKAYLYGAVPDDATRERALQLVIATPGITMVEDRTRRQ